MDLIGKSVVMVIAPENFRDEEFLFTKEVLENHDVDVTVASKGVSKAKGSLGATVDIDKEITDIKIDDYDALVFVGGSGTNVYFNDETALGIARDFYESGKIT
ncbi:MAG: DJ-1/PfpI family protein, partial [Candidatus Nanoarchaeia archaeon]|nr:DJ-1/PfpI family protein [Candidatus Nanoarchaeia archaeon]